MITPRSVSEIARPVGGAVVGHAQRRAPDA